MRNAAIRTVHLHNLLMCAPEDLIGRCKDQMFWYSVAKAIKLILSEYIIKWTLLVDNNAIEWIKIYVFCVGFECFASVLVVLLPEKWRLPQKFLDNCVQFE